MVAEGEGVCMWVDIVDGRIVRADHVREGVWPLGDLFIHLGFLRAHHLSRIGSRAAKESRSPESVLLDKELISLALLKRFRERLTIQNLLALGLTESFRAELKQVPLEDLQAKEWDVEIPIEYALRAINGALEERAGWDGVLPEPEARFEQRRAALKQMLKAQEEQDQGTDVLDWTPEVRRIFFLCNGRTPFSVFPMIVGQSSEQVARHLEEMLERGLIDLATRSVSRMDIKERMGGAMRLISSFGVGLVSIALLVTILVQVSAFAREDLKALPPRSMQAAHVQSRATALGKVDTALSIYKRMEDRFPSRLSELRMVTGIRPSLLDAATYGADLKYAAEPSGLGYKLSLEENPKGTHGDSGD
jgi:hypothetical protein